MRSDFPGGSWDELVELAEAIEAHLDEAFNELDPRAQERLNDHYELGLAPAPGDRSALDPRPGVDRTAFRTVLERVLEGARQDAPPEKREVIERALEGLRGQRTWNEPKRW